MVHHLIHFSRPLYFYEPFHWNYNHGKKSVVLFITFYAWKESLNHIKSFLMFFFSQNIHEATETFRLQQLMEKEATLQVK
jgi:hypothetical protein